MYSVGLPLVPLAVGDVVDRSAWPAHVTLIGNFLLPEGAADTAIAVLRRFAAGVRMIPMRVQDEAWFGPDGSVLVDLVEPQPLRELHGGLLTALEAAIEGLQTIEPVRTRDGYHPHRTVTAGARPARGDALTATDVVLSELEPEGMPGMAVVIARWRLGGAAHGEAEFESVAVHRVLDRLDRAAVRAWVIGGWGVDALNGRQTRPHHDLDLFTAAEDTATAVSALTGIGYVVRFVWSENRWTERDGRLVPSAFVAVDAEGREVDVHTLRVERGQVAPVSDSSVELPHGAFDASGSIGGLPVPCASVAAQLLMHTGYPLPERQVTDVALLERLAHA